MKAVVIYDTTFGNTKLIADSIADQLGEGVKSISVKDIKNSDLVGIELLVVGSPIIAWKPSENMGKFLATLVRDQLKGIKAIAFDTRVKLFVSGDAAKKISKVLANSGAEIIADPQAFYVRGKEGPLLDREIEKAKDWAKLIKSKI